MTNGARTLYVHCDDWRVTTDKEFPIGGFRSAEKWQLIGVVDGRVRLIIPGCRVNALTLCDAPEFKDDVYCLGDAR